MNNIIDIFRNLDIIGRFWFFILLVVLIIKLSLAQIPAYIAAKKGYSFVGFLFFGLFFFLIALVVSLLITDRLSPLPVQVVHQYPEKGSLFDKLTDLNKAYDLGLINDDEYRIKKESYLKEY